VSATILRAVHIARVRALSPTMAIDAASAAELLSAGIAGLQKLLGGAAGQLQAAPTPAHVLTPTPMLAPAPVLMPAPMLAPAPMLTPTPAPIPSSHRDHLKIFVGGLAQHTTKAALDGHFNQYGVADSFVMIDGASGRSRGFGFVNFADEATMNTVLSMPHEVDGVWVTTSAYNEKRARAGSGGASRPPTIRGPVAIAPADANSFVDPNQGLHPAVYDTQVALDPQANRPKIFVGGLSPTTTKEQLNIYFSQFGHCDSIVMFDKVTGRSRGFGFVDFADETARDVALQMPHQVDGVQVTVSAYDARGAGRPRGGGSAADGSELAAGGGGGAQGTVEEVVNSTLAVIAQLQGSARAMRAQQAVEAIASLTARTSEGSCQLSVDNLSVTTTSAMLQEVFGIYGPCECEVLTDPLTGLSQSCGLVNFSTPEHARVALRDQHVIEGRLIDVTESWDKGSGKGRPSPY